MTMCSWVGCKRIAVETDPSACELHFVTAITPPPRSTANAVEHPAHYGGAEDPYEAIKVIEAWGLGFCLGNCLKYIRRAGRKDPAARLEDLRKGRWYLDREIQRLEMGE